MAREAVAIHVRQSVSAARQAMHDGPSGATARIAVGAGDAKIPTALPDYGSQFPQQIVTANELTGPAIFNRGLCARHVEAAPQFRASDLSEAAAAVVESAHWFFSVPARRLTSALGQFLDLHRLRVTAVAFAVPPDAHFCRLRLEEVARPREALGIFRLLYVIGPFAVRFLAGDEER